MIFELTKDTIAGIIATGKNTNSALAEAYIAHVKSKCGYDVFACYASAFQELSTDGTHLINQFELDVYLKGFPLKNPITDHLKDMLFDCFIEVLDDNGVTLESIPVRTMMKATGLSTLLSPVQFNTMNLFT